MSKYLHGTELDDIPLGKTSQYISQYSPHLLYPVPRKLNRDHLGLTDPTQLPFTGSDIWHGYELSWLNSKGKPQVALARFEFAAASVNLVESKSFKLYLNSFNQTRFDSNQQVQQILQQDLTATALGPVKVTLFRPNELDYFRPTALPGICIDDLDIAIDHYAFDPELLSSDHDNVITETVHSHLLKSNCLITSQPDWGSVVISYTGPAIDHEALLRYLISFRQHNEFHEQCVERIFCDINSRLQPSQLQVGAYYTRRGGLDISPWRCNDNSSAPFFRSNRQ